MTMSVNRDSYGSIDKPTSSGDKRALVSMKPGVRNLPVASMVRAPAGMLTRPRGPAATTFVPETTTTASGTAAPPLPSMRVAPTIAIVPPWRGGAPASGEVRAEAAAQKTQVRVKDGIGGLQVALIVANARRARQ